MVFALITETMVLYIIALCMLDWCGINSRIMGSIDSLLCSYIVIVTGGLRAGFK